METTSLIRLRTILPGRNKIPFIGLSTNTLFIVICNFAHMSFAGTPRLIAQQRTQRSLAPVERMDARSRTTVVEEVDKLATLIQRIDCKFFLKLQTCLHIQVFRCCFNHLTDRIQTLNRQEYSHQIAKTKKSPKHSADFYDIEFLKVFIYSFLCMTHATFHLSP